MQVMTIVFIDSSSSSSWKREVHHSTASAQSTASLSPKSLLCIRFGSSRSCSRSSSPLVRPSAHNLRQSAPNIIAEIDDKITSDSRKIVLEKESQEDLSQQAQVPQCLKVPSTPSSAERENFMNSLIFPSGHGARFVRAQKDFMVSTDIRLRRNQV